MSCGLTRASGIRPGFPGLSQTWGQVAHVLLTRSPLALHRCCHRMVPARLACIKHAASVRPEPGSNSPSKPCHPGDPGKTIMKSWPSPAPRGGRPGQLAETFCVVRLRYEMTIRRSTAHGDAGSPALTFEPSVPFSRCNHCVRDTGQSPEVRLTWPSPSARHAGGGFSDWRSWARQEHRPPQGRRTNILNRPGGVNSSRRPQPCPRYHESSRGGPPEAGPGSPSGRDPRPGRPTPMAIPASTSARGRPPPG